MIIKPAGTQMGRRLLKLSIRQELTNGNVKSVKGLFQNFLTSKNTKMTTTPINFNFRL